MPGFTTDLIEGLADWLATQVSTLTWKPTQTYTATETGLYVWSLPATPDRGVALALYATDDGPIVGTDRVGIQLRTRGTRDIRTATDVDDAIFDVLHAAEHLSLGGIHVALARRISRLPMGVDDGGRHEVSSNYTLTLDRPTTHRND